MTCSLKFEYNNLKYFKKIVNDAERKKLWWEEIMWSCDVICGRTKKRCGVPSLPPQLCQKTTTFPVSVRHRFPQYALNISLQKMNKSLQILN